MKKGGGRRYYRREDITLLSGIRAMLYDDGSSIKDVQAYLKNKGVVVVSARAEKASPVATDNGDEDVEEDEIISSPKSESFAENDDGVDYDEVTTQNESHERLSGALEKLLKARKQLNQSLEKH